VTSVAGRTGAVVLSTADISGLATVATSGAYSDLSGTPSLATVATTGAYSDLTGTPTLGTAAAEDVGTSAGNVVQLNGSAQLPAVDGSLLTNISATVAALNDVGDVTITTPANTQVIKYNSTSGDWENGAVAYADVSGTPSLATIATTGDYSDLNDSVVVQQFNATATASAISSNALHIFRMYGAGGFTLSLSTSTALNGFALFNNISGSDVTVNGGTFRANGEGTTGGSSSITVKAGERRLYYVEGASLYLEANSTLIEHNADVNISSPTNGEALIYNSTSGDWENSAVAYADVSGTPSLATVATTGAYSDLSGTPSLATVATTGAYSDLSGLPTLGTAAALDVGTSATNVVQLDGSARLPAVDGSQLTNLPSGASTLGALTDVTITTPANTQVIKYNSTSGDWENGSVAYADVSGTPTLATVATTGAYSDLSGTPTLATVATTGAYSDLSGLPTLGTAAALDVGTSANNVVQLNGSAQLPAVDGSQLTGISATVAALNDIGDVSAATPNNGDVIAYNSTSGDWEATAQSGGGSAPSVTVSSPSTTQTLSAPSGIEEAYIYTPTTAITVNLVAAATCGSGFKYQIKNRSTNTININPNGSETVDGAATFTLNTQEASVTLITDGSNWFII